MFNHTAVWSSIQVELTSYMLQIRSHRLNSLWSTTLDNRGEQLSMSLWSMVLEQNIKSTVPNPADLYQESEVFKRLLTTPLTDDEEDPLTSDDYAVALRQIPQFVTTWEQKKRNLLISLLPNVESAPVSALSDRPIDRLALATSIFNCRRCDHNCKFGNPKLRCYHSSNLLAHECPYRTSTEYPNLVYGDMESDLGFHSWLGANAPYCFDEQAADRAAALVEACGLEPDFATADDMDALDARFICSCLWCKHAEVNDDETVPALTWRQAVGGHNNQWDIA